MKRTRILCMMVLALSLAILSGCQKKDAAADNSENKALASSDISQSTALSKQEEASTGLQETASEDAKSDPADLAVLDGLSPVVASTTAASPARAAAGEENVDVDLTRLSTTIAISEIYNMLVNPDDYMGKTVKMDGQFSYYYNENTDIYYFACIKQDVTGCCGQALEFALQDEAAFPADYPEVGSDMTLVGTYSTYEENGYTYSFLDNARFV